MSIAFRVAMAAGSAPPGALKDAKQQQAVERVVHAVLRAAAALKATP